MQRPNPQHVGFNGRILPPYQHLYSQPVAVAYSAPAIPGPVYITSPYGAYPTLPPAPPRPGSGLFASQQGYPAPQRPGSGLFASQQGYPTPPGSGLFASQQGYPAPPNSSLVASQQGYPTPQRLGSGLFASQEGYPPPPQVPKNTNTYIISSHGYKPVSKNNYEPPRGVELIFYVKEGQTLQCPPKLQTQICAGGLPSKSRYIKEIVANKLHRTSRFNQNRIMYSNKTIDYELSNDTGGEFSSGAVDCPINGHEKSIIVYNIQNSRPIYLSKLVKLIVDYNSNNYPGTNIQIHCLFCRGSENAVYVAGKRTKNKTRKNMRKNKTQRRQTIRHR